MSGNRKIGPDDVNVVISFGGGLHTRASVDDINEREAADGRNFILDVQNRNLRPRQPFDLIGTVPNGASILGGGSLLKADGTVSTLIQAGDTVYEWDGGTTFTSKGTVSATSKLRGHWRSHNWTLGNVLILTDLNLDTVVKTWDGTTFASAAFLKLDTSSFGNFFAKYVNVSNERAVFSNVNAGSADLPHMVVGSKRGDYLTISSTERPASGNASTDPWFLLSPDLKPINGHVESFGTTIISTEKGQLFDLSGSDATDFAFTPFFPGSGASGYESVAYIGNDIVYGRQGRIESVTDTNKFGDSENDDLTLEIADQIEDYTGWTSVYNSRLDLVYFFPSGQSEVWVLNKALRGADLSPWMRWETIHSMSFEPTMAMSMLDPVDGLEYVFMGDSSGNFYRLEGSGHNGDAGSLNIETEFLTKIFTGKLDAQVYDIEGYVRYEKNEAFTLELIFEYAGEELFNRSLTVDIPAVATGSYYGGTSYYGGSGYYGSISGRLARTKFKIPGQANEFQVRVKVSSVSDFSIHSIGLRFRQAS